MLTRINDYLIAIYRDNPQCYSGDLSLVDGPIEAIETARLGGWSAMLGRKHICQKCSKRGDV